MFVVCDPTPNLHDTVDVYLAKGVEPIHIPGYIVHRHSDGVGMIFRELDPAARALIDKWLD